MGLDAQARKAGHKEMEKSLTPAARVRRKMQGGRHMKVSRELTATQAVFRLITDMEKAEALMLKERLDPADLKVGLIYSLPTPEPEGSVGFIVAGESPTEFFQKVDGLGPEARFLGEIWEQNDHDSARAGDAPIFVWIRPFVVDPDSVMRMGLLRAQVSEGAKRLIN